MSDARTSLKGKIAVVTGASRGVGKGVAIALAKEGMKVYCVARSVRAGSSSLKTGGSLEETVGEIAAGGGEAVAVGCDVTDEGQISELFERVEKENGGRLDVLVNSAWGGYEKYVDGSEYEDFKPFWEVPGKWWDAMFEAGVRGCYFCSREAARRMVVQKSGLIVTVSFFAGKTYMKPVCYGVAKAASDRMMADMAVELREHGVATVSLYPGLVRTEGVMLNSQYFDMSNSESMEFQGMAVAGLLRDPKLMEKSGRVVVSAELAREYKLVDVDGRSPHSVRWMYQPA